MYVCVCVGGGAGLFRYSHDVDLYGHEGLSSYMVSLCAAALSTQLVAIYMLVVYMYIAFIQGSVHAQIVAWLSSCRLFLKQCPIAPQHANQHSILSSTLSRDSC